MPSTIGGRAIPDAPESAREAIGLRCDVTTWDDQVKLFEAAVETYHSVDIVVRSGPPLWSRCPQFILPLRSRTLGSTRSARFGNQNSRMANQ